MGGRSTLLWRGHPLASIRATPATDCRLCHFLSFRCQNERSATRRKRNSIVSLESPFGGPAASSLGEASGFAPPPRGGFAFFQDFLDVLYLFFVSLFRISYMHR